MALIVEDGTGLPDANAFITQEWCRGYWTDREKAFRGSTDEQIQAAIIRATQFISEGYAWKGYRTKRRPPESTKQALTWPRFDASDEEGNTVEFDAIPLEIRQATAEAAHYELDNPGGLQPHFVAHQKVSKLRAGSVEVDYDARSGRAAGARPVLLLVEDLVSRFVAGGSGLSRTAVRA